MAVFRNLTIATHVLTVLMAVSIPIFIFNGTLFSWHPSFMAVGFLGLMTEGILTSISFRNLEGNDRLSKIWVHFAWQIMALICIIAGFTTIYQNKVNGGKSHFTSLHGKFGITTFVLALTAALGGVLGFRQFGIFNKLPDKLQPVVKAAHRNAGLIVWLLALFTIELALTHHAVWKGLSFLAFALLLFGGKALSLVIGMSINLTNNLQIVLEGFISKVWQAGTLAIAGGVLWDLYLQKKEGRRKLPVYAQNGRYGVVTAADELSKTS